MKIKESAVELGFWLGFVELFGIGEYHLGSWRKGVGFWVSSGVLYTCVLGALAMPGLAFMWGHLPLAGGLLFCLQSFDIFQLTDRLDGGFDL